MADPGASGSSGSHQQQYNAYMQPDPPTLSSGAATALPPIPLPLDAQQQQAAAKQSLKQWWTKFTKQQQQQQQAAAAGGSSSAAGRSPAGNAGPSGHRAVFGVPLTESLKYAGVAISMVGPDGVNQVYGYIPIVVAKCGLFLKQKAITVEGVFRISGSTRRMKELQDIFDRPPSYGKDVVWGPWSVHDAANVLRRYLNRMPEPVVPHELYEDFRNALPPLGKVNEPDAILASVAKYKALIAVLPASSKYLLCYVLDLLNVFARNHESNLMPASNLAVVFQPGLIRGPDNYESIPGAVPGAIPIPNAGSVPGSGEASEASSAFSPPVFPQMARSSSNPVNHYSEPASSAASSTTGSQSNVLELQRRQDEIKINQEVLEFLINHQDHFVALPEPLSSSSAEASPISPQSATGAPEWSQQTPQARATAKAQVSLPTLAEIQQQPAQAYPLSPPTAPFASMQLASRSRQSSPSRAPAPSQSDAPVIASRSQSVQHDKASIPPISTGRAAPGPATATFPLKQASMQQQQAATYAPSVSAATYKEKEKEHRQPRKLKKGRTPNTSGAGTPTSPPPNAAFWDPASHHPQYAEPGSGQSFSRGSSPMAYPGLSSGRASHVGSSMPSPVQTAIVQSYDDDDVPLSAVTLRAGSASPNSGVKRSRTLPSPGSRGASPRSVSSRRQSDSRGSPSPSLSPSHGQTAQHLDVPGVQTSRAASPKVTTRSTEVTVTGPLQSAGHAAQLQSALLERSASAQTASTQASSMTDQSFKTPASDAHAFSPPPPVDLDSEYSEATDDDDGNSSSRRKGWRKAFSRSKKGSEGSTRSTSPGRTVSTSQASTAPSKKAERVATSVGVGQQPLAVAGSGRRLSIGQGNIASRRKSVEGSRPITPLRESHVPAPSFNTSEPARSVKGSKESQKQSVTPGAGNQEKTMSGSTPAPIPIRSSKTSPSGASAAADRAISDLLAASPSESKITAGSTHTGGSGSRKFSAASMLGRSPGNHSHTAISPPGTSLYGTSPSADTSGKLTAVKNPRPQGQEKEGGGAFTKREAKRMADDLAKKDISAIKDAVANIGRPS